MRIECTYLRWLSYIFIAATVFAAGTAGANKKSIAKKHFENGLAMMEVEDFTGAAVEFEASVRALATKSALFNLAMCYKAVHRYPEALGAFRRLMREFGNTMDPEMRKETKSNIAAIRNIIGEIELLVTPHGAAVWLDGKNVGVTPLRAPLTVGAGEHQIRVTLAGHEDANRTIAVVSGTKKVVNIALAPLPDDTKPPVAPVVTKPLTPEPTPTATPLAQPKPATPSPAPKAAPAAKLKVENDDPNLEVMETVLGRSLARDHKRFSRSHLRHQITFVDYEYNLARKKRNKGIVVSCVVAPLVAVAGIVIYSVFLGRANDAWDEGYDTNAEAFETMGSVFLGLASIGTLVSVTVGTVKWIRGARDMRRIKPHLTNQAQSKPGIRFAGFSPVFDPTSDAVGGSVAFQF